ncbi:hypothetical protein BBJ28_00015891 [Nothophytophthora sp. Chile5]|nr:hypothetical protein BBJ28_00015891 [Nothophytophthora sp. Chile5]
MDGRCVSTLPACARVLPAFVQFKLCPRHCQCPSSMGITLSQPAANSSSEDSPLAVAAVAEITQCTFLAALVAVSPLQASLTPASLAPSVDVKQLRALHAAWKHDDGSDAPGNLTSREPDLFCDEFDEALDSAQFAASDRAIFDRLFTLLDRTGDDRILASEFLVAASLLLRGSLHVKLQAALDFASGSDGQLSPKTLTFTLTTLAAIAGFFGDPAVSSVDVSRVVSDVTADPSLAREDLVTRIATHPVVTQYVDQTLDPEASP